jgi:hypothetical protein
LDRESEADEEEGELAGEEEGAQTAEGYWTSSQHSLQSLRLLTSTSNK